MANRRFIDFPIASTVGDSDIILIWQSGANKQTTKATFLSGLPENLEDLNDGVRNMVYTAVSDAIVKTGISGGGVWRTLTT